MTLAAEKHRNVDRSPTPTCPQDLITLARSLVAGRRKLELWSKRLLGLIQPPRIAPADLEQGLTLVLPGIEAESVFTYGICHGLRRGGVAGAVAVFNWGLPFPGGYLANLARLDRNRRQAQRLAQRIIDYQNRYPGRPTQIVAHSGGVGIAVFAAEQLPPDHPVDSLVLLSGALSPQYDLRPALQHTRRGILNTYSLRDQLVLKWGTTIFGTTDRVHGPGCGYAGFVPPAGAADAYAKLTQIRWDERMAQECQHNGGHTTATCEEYLTRYICPWLTER